jgi:hypothetical protein
MLAVRMRRSFGSGMSCEGSRGVGGRTTLDGDRGGDDDDERWRRRRRQLSGSSSSSAAHFTSTSAAAAVAAASSSHKSGSDSSRSMLESSALLSASETSICSPRSRPTSSTRLPARWRLLASMEDGSRSFHAPTERYCATAASNVEEETEEEGEGEGEEGEEAAGRGEKEWGSPKYTLKGGRAGRGRERVSVGI